MAKRLTTCSTIGILAIVLIHPAAMAQWTYDWGALIENVNENNPPAFVADGSGGVIVAWASTNAGNDDIYAQRFDDHGNALWAAGGVPVCTNAAIQNDPRVVEDGAGGVYITWQDLRESGSGIYGQRLTTYGFAYWDVDGIPIAWEDVPQINHQTISDGFGGLLVVWQQFELPYYQIRSQRVGADGTLLWGSSVLTAAAAGSMRYPDLVLLPAADESDTRITVVWTDYRDSALNGTDIYTQRMTLDGVVQWASDGVVVYAGADDQRYPDLVASGSSSTIISWRDYRDADDRGFCQKIDRYGNRLWGSTGGDVTWSSQHDEFGPRMVSDGADGVFITCGSFAFHLNQDGYSYWGHNLYSGVSVGAYNARPVRMENGDCVVVYHRHAIHPDPLHVKANRYAAVTGDSPWGVYGATITDFAYYGAPPDVICSADGIIAGWNFAYIDYHAAVQRLDLEEGYWGYPKPVIAELVDAVQDEGGWLKMTVLAPTIDDELVPMDVATGYNIWRRALPRPVENQATAEDVLASVEALEKTAGLHVSGPEAIALRLPDGDWESLGFHAAMQESSYDFIVPTRTDATNGSEPYDVFVVTVHTTTPNVYFCSLPDSAYSVDNLAPGLLQGLNGEAVYDPVGLNLSWQALTESDLTHYVIHRGTNGSFLPDETNRVATPTLAAWLDDGWAVDAGYYYKVAGVDRHGNVGEFGTLSPDEMSGVSSGFLPGRVSLNQNHPNPFNPQTTIAFDLPNEMAVSLHVYDLSGRLVDVLLDSEVAQQGRNEVVWRGRDTEGRAAPAGTYFYRLEAGGYGETKMMTLLK